MFFVDVPEFIEILVFNHEDNISPGTLSFSVCILRD